MEIALYKNGAIWRVGDTERNDTGGTVLQPVGLSASGKLDAADVITIWTRHGSAAPEALITSAGYNYFDGTRINLG